jgi:hypothetical protein
MCDKHPVAAPPSTCQLSGNVAGNQPTTNKTAVSMIMHARCGLTINCAAARRLEQPCKDEARNEGTNRNEMALRLGEFPSSAM